MGQGYDGLLVFISWESFPHICGGVGEHERRSGGGGGGNMATLGNVAWTTSYFAEELSRATKAAAFFAPNAFDRLSSSKRGTISWHHNRPS